MSKRESYVKDRSGRTVGKHTTWTETGRTHVYETYKGTRTPKRHLGDIVRNGKRSSWRPSF